PIAPIAPPASTAIAATFTTPLAASFTTRPLPPRRTLTATRRAIKVRSVSGLFHEVRYVKERIPLEPNIHKARLHARQNARHTPVINRASERVLILAPVINSWEFFFFDNRH